MENYFINQRGIIAIIALIALGVLLIIGSYFLSFTITESKISKSQETATQAYYLAEAGINEAIWKLKNDETFSDGDDPWEINFATSTYENCETWSDSFSRSDTLFEGGSYTVTIQNSACAKGQITSTAKIELPGGKTTQRVIKTVVFKSLASPTADAAVLSGGASENIDIKSSKIRVHGNFFSNHNLDIKQGSTIEVYAIGTAEGKILAVGNYSDTGSSVSSTAICAKDICNTTSTCDCQDTGKFEKCEENSCPPLKISMPIVDFDSSATTSFKMRAQAAEDDEKCEMLCNGNSCTSLCNGTLCKDKCVFNGDEFEKLLWEAGEGGTLTLNTTTTPGIVYVTDPIELRGGRHLVVNGALVADGTINIGERYSWTKGGQKDEGNSQITINQPTDTITSGLLTKAKINFGSYSSFTTTTITGVIYANDEIRVVSLPKSFIVRGGIMARKLSFTSVLKWFDLVLNNEIIRYGLGYKINGTPIVPQYSPIITVEHWEESY